MGCKNCLEKLNENFNEQILIENNEENSNNLLKSSNNHNNYFNNMTNLEINKYIKEVINLINLKRTLI